MDKLVALLKEKNLTISTCESLTAGLYSAKLAEISGVSQVLKGGIVTYWNSVKVFAGVKEETVETDGVVSEKCSIEMAQGVKVKLATDIGVSFTGNAGPDVMEGKEAGLVYTCIIVKDKCYPFKDVIKMSRNELREEICNRTTERLINILGEY